MTDRRTISARSIAQAFGLRGPVARCAIRALCESAPAPTASPPVAADAWLKLAKRLQLPASGIAAGFRSYYIAVIQAVTHAIAGRHLHAPSELDGELEAVANDLRSPGAPDGTDLFQQFHNELFPRALRHESGQYYTPDWLADLVLEESGWQGDSSLRLVDPTCGSGVFLLAALRAVRRRWEAGARHEPAAQLGRRVLENIAGFDADPLAVLTAQANFLIALADWLPPDEPIPLPIHQRDVLLDPASGRSEEPFDFVVGNPPWIAWDHLAPELRRATLPLWERYGLFTLSANAARHGGAKKDLSMLVTYACADRYLRTGGRLGFVITQTAFQSHGAGDGFRRFRLGAEGPELAVLRVHDLVALRPFAPASNWTSVLVLEKGRPTSYPVPYVKWLPGRVQRPCTARPADPQRPGSPWLVAPPGLSVTGLAGPSHYTAHLGANSGGANAVFWLDVLQATRAGLLVRNASDKGKRRVPAVEQHVEPELVYPLLRWADVARWRAEPSGHILLVQDAQTRQGIPEELLQSRCPQAYAYLLPFRELLAARAAYRRYQGRGPFYAMYNVGPYTLAPVKVVWRRMDRTLRAAVVGQREVPGAGLKPVVPQETCVLLPAADPDEAHYLCALVNSSLSAFLARASSVDGGKGFGTPGVLEYLNLRRYEPGDPRHRELSELSRQAHRAVALGDDPRRFEEPIDGLAADLSGVDAQSLVAIRDELAALSPRTTGATSGDRPPRRSSRTAARP